MSISTSKFFKGNKIARARRVNAICSLFTRVNTLHSCCFKIHSFSANQTRVIFSCTLLRYFLVEDPLKSVVQQGLETKNIGFFCIGEDKAS